MKTQDLMMILTAALATASLTVLAFWPGTLEAGNDADTPATRIAKPKLVSHGIEMTLVAAQGRPSNADEPTAFELTAVNTTDAPATVAVRIAMTASSPADAMSRVPRLPKALWQQNQPVALQAHETKVFAIAVPVKAPPNSMIAVSLQDAGPDAAESPAVPGSTPARRFAGLPQSGIVALNFPTPGPAVQSAAAN